MPVVIDTSVAIKWVLPEDATANARALRDDAIARDDTLYAPSLIVYEATNVLYQQVRRGILTRSSAQQRVAGVLAPLRLRTASAAITRRAIEIADLAGEHYAYDVHFLALAERLGCDLWTADEDFRRAMNRNGFAQVQSIRAYSLPPSQ